MSWLRARLPRTLRSRLTVWGVAVVAVWVVALTVGFNWLLSHQLDNQVDDLLRTRAQAVSATVDVDAGGRVSLREVVDDAALDEGVWIYAGTRAIERPPRAPASIERLAEGLVGGSGFVEKEGLRGFRLLAYPVRYDGRQVSTVVVSESLTPYVNAERVALLASLGLGALFVLGIWPAVRLTVGRALAPVGAMTRQAADWSEHDLSRRFGAATRPEELATLAATLDSVLDRLAAVVRHEQQLSGELSHELRTPLARISAETDWLLARPRSAAELRTSHEAIADGTRHLLEILETLLATARAGLGAAPGSCEVAAVVDSALARHRDSGHRLEAAIEPGTVAGVDAAVLDRILGPVLENAVRYARSTVTVAGATRDGSVRLEVRDDGPGIRDGDRELVFVPGSRADPDDGHDGAGLGLALSRRLAAAVEGTVEVGPAGRPTGASIRVQVPAA